jgi:hypothetical protein
MMAWDGLRENGKDGAWQFWDGVERVMWFDSNQVFIIIVTD